MESKSKKNNNTPMVKNMDTNGQIQCPHCWRFFNIPDGADYKPGVCICAWCGKKMEIGQTTACFIQDLNA